MDSKQSLNKTFLCEFIAIYKSYPCLWKVKSKEYRDRAKKSKAYDVLVEKMREIEPNANRETVIKKINSLRSCFRKEFKKIIKSKESGAGEDDVYTPNLWYFDLLSFLSDQKTPYTSRSSLEDDEEIMSPVSNQSFDLHSSQTEESEVCMCPTSPASDIPIISRKHKRKVAVDPADILITNACEKWDNNREDQFDTVGKTVALKLRSLPNEQRIFAEKLINDVLFEAELGTLNRNYRLEYQ